MLRKNKKVNDEITESNIEILANKIKEIKKRIEEQKLNIYIEIEKLEKEFENPDKFKVNKINSFDINKINGEIEATETRESLGKKIYCLKQAKEFPIYNDEELFGSIKEYLAAIRPEIEKLDAIQWKLLTEKNKIIKEYTDKLNGISGQYRETETEISEMLKIADIGYPKTGYNKQLFVPGDPTWQANPSNVVDLVDVFLKEDAAGYAFGINSCPPNAEQPSNIAKIFDSLFK